MKVLILTNHYMDDNNGGANGSKAYIRALSELYNDCTLIYPKRIEEKTKPFIPKGVRAIPVYDKRNKIRKGLDIYRGVLTRLPQYVKKHLIDNKYDIIVVDHSVVAGGLLKSIKRTQSKIITIHHNNETQYLRDNPPGVLYRIPQLYFATKAENDCINMSVLNITVTEHDAQSFRERFPTKNIHVYNMGTYLYEDLNSTLESQEAPGGKTFAITGSLQFPQSVQPVIDFIERYYPILMNRIPNARLIIAGRNPTDELKDACRKHQSILLYPNPDNMQEVLKSVGYYICPIYLGSGVKLRAMDGLRQGMPVISHEVSINGYEHIVDDNCMFGYHDEKSFAEALERMMKCNHTPQEVYKSFYSYFCFNAGKTRLKEILLKENLI